MQIVFGNDTNWAYLSKKHILIAGKNQYLDIVFYNVFSHRYLIFELKTKSSAASVNRGKSQLDAYQKAINLGLDYSFQKDTIAILLSKAPIHSEFFSHTSTRDLMFYVGFTL
jgi:hypothetical protein